MPTFMVLKRSHMKNPERSDRAQTTLVDAREAGRLLGLKPATVRRWLASGRLERVVLSPRAIRVERAALSRFIQSRTEAVATSETDLDG